MEDEREEGISLIQLIKVMFGRKLILLISTLAIGLIGTLAIVLGINKGKEVYTASFTYSDPVIQQGKYIDGSSFYYQSLITEDNLKTIKESDKKFSSINVKDLLEKDAISISLTSSYSDDDSKKIVSQKYTIKTKKSYYSSKSQAKNFVSAIAESVTNTNSTKARNLKYDSNLSSYESALTFLLKAEYLSSQLEYLDTNYDDLIESYGDYVISSTSKNISSYKAELDAYYKNYPLEVLSSEIMNNVYVLNKENDELYEQYYINYNKLYELNEKKIDSLQQKVDTLIVTASGNLQTVELADYNAKIAALTIENQDYKEQINYLGNVLGLTPQTIEKDGIEVANPDYKPVATDAQNKAFLEKIDTYFNKMKECTETYSAIILEVASDNNNIYYTSGGVIKQSGGISPILAVVISLVLGCGAGCFINLVLDYKKLNPDYVEPSKEEDKKEGTEE